MMLEMCAGGALDDLMLGNDERCLFTLKFSNKFGLLQGKYNNETIIHSYPLLVRVSVKLTFSRDGFSGRNSQLKVWELTN